MWSKKDWEEIFILIRISSFTLASKGKINEADEERVWDGVIIEKVTGFML